MSGEQINVNPAALAEAWASGRPIRRIPTEDKVIAFTFDDGPWPRNTEAVMSHFERDGSPATFFMIGLHVERFPTIARSVAQRGYSIGAHSITHRYDEQTIIDEVGRGADLIAEATGVRPLLFRSPGLVRGAALDAAVSAAGLLNVSTAFDFNDWKVPRLTSSTLISRFEAALRPGAIVLLHDGGGAHDETVEAIPEMLAHARRNGYTVVDLADVFARALNIY